MATLLRIVWGLARKAGLSEEELRDVVESVSSQRSTKAMSLSQTQQVIDRLRDLAGQPRSHPKTRVTHEYPKKRHSVQDNGIVVQMVSPMQRRFIDWLLRERIDLAGKDPSAYLRTICMRVFKHGEPRTAREAGLIIGNLRRQAARQAHSGLIPTFEDFCNEM